MTCAQINSYNNPNRPWRMRPSPTIHPWRPKIPCHQWTWVLFKKRNPHIKATPLGTGKRRGKKQSLRKHDSKARKHQEEGKFLLVPSTSRSQKCGFLQRMSHRGTLYGILGNFPTQDKFYASLFSLFYIVNIMDHCPTLFFFFFLKGGKRGHVVIFKQS